MMRRWLLSFALLLGLLVPAAATLTTTNLSGFNAYTAAASGPTLTYINTFAATSSGATGTYTDADIGAAAADRFVVVVVSARSGSTGTISSMTIGGNAATELVENLQATSPGQTSCAIYGLTVTSGTTATIVGTASANINATTGAMTFHVYTVTGLNSTTPTATATLSYVDDPTGNITATAGGIVITGSMLDGSNTHAWAGGLTENYDAAQNARGRSTASATGTSAGSFAIDLTTSSTNASRVCAIAMK